MLKFTLVAIRHFTVCRRRLGSWPNHDTGDFVVMPNAEQFESAAAYYETCLHELAHWSEVRTAWDREKHGYAMGELIAEMASCFVSVGIGIPAIDLGNHAAYLQIGLRQCGPTPALSSRQAPKPAKPPTT